MKTRMKHFRVPPLLVFSGALTWCHGLIVTRRNFGSVNGVSLGLYSRGEPPHTFTCIPRDHGQKCIARPFSSTLAASSQSATTPSTSTTTTSTEESEITLNPLISSIKISKTVEIFSLVKQMEADGTHVTSLCVGEPDFPPPQIVLQAATDAIRNCDTRYTAVTGTAELRNAIAQDLYKRKGLHYNPQTEIVVGNGAKQCVYQGILATCGQGDAVLISSPYWPSYPEMAALVGAVPIILPTKEQDGYLIQPQELRQILQNHSNVKLFIFCNPCNPTGSVHDFKRLQQIAQVLEDFPQVVVLADEIYERLVYSHSDHDNNDDKSSSATACPSFASMPNMFHRTLTVNGFSKSYAMTGMRLGYLAAPAKFARAATTIQSQLTSCAGSISQAAGVAALTKVSEEEMQHNVDVMKEKRDYVLQQLRSMPGVQISVPPNGAFYVLPDISFYCNEERGMDDTALCLELLKTKKLALVPGSSFGAPGTVRISYATSTEELEVAMKKLREFLEEKSSVSSAAGAVP